MTKRIHQFTMTGECEDNYFAENKEGYLRWMRRRINEQGYGLLLDVNPEINFKYNTYTELFEYDVTLCGVYMGKKNAFESLGIYNGIVQHKTDKRSFAQKWIENPE